MAVPTSSTNVRMVSTFIGHHRSQSKRLASVCVDLAIVVLMVYVNYEVYPITNYVKEILDRSLALIHGANHLLEGANL